ncbi:MAG: hypothetical protein V1738_04380 [Patescibacteria group bacterium]
MTILTERLFEDYRLLLACDVMQAMQSGSHVLGEICALVVRADIPYSRVLVELLCPDHDWSQYDERGEFGVLYGLAPDWLIEKLDQMAPETRAMRFRAATSSICPAWIMADGSVESFDLHVVK